MQQEHPLVTEYRKTIPEKIESISSLIADVKNLKTLESLQSLRQAVHKLAGNSGTYGFMKVSNACKELDLDLQEKIQSFNPDILTIQWLSGLDIFLKNLKIHFSKPDIIIEL
jgi:HPt (histidine-containing phosphotransfer) domain-containing protein